MKLNYNSSTLLVSNNVTIYSIKVPLPMFQSQCLNTFYLCCCILTHYPTAALPPSYTEFVESRQYLKHVPMISLNSNIVLFTPFFVFEICGYH